MNDFIPPSRQQSIIDRSKAELRGSGFGLGGRWVKKPILFRVSTRHRDTPARKNMIGRRTQCFYLRYHPSGLISITITVVCDRTAGQCSAAAAEVHKAEEGMVRMRAYVYIHCVCGCVCECVCARSLTVSPLRSKVRRVEEEVELYTPYTGRERYSVYTSCAQGHPDD